MHPITRLFILTLTATCLLSGCKWGDDKDKARANKPPRSIPLAQGPNTIPNANPIDTSALQNTPIVEFWDNGNFLNNRPSELLFAVWQDGKVMRLLNGRAYFGYISNVEVSRLMERLGRAGVEAIPFSTGIVYPDGGSQMLYIDVNGVQILMRHDGSFTSDDLDSYDLPPNITRIQMQRFLDIWSRSVAALDDVWPLHLDLTTGIPAVPYPSLRSTPDVRENQ